ncbi:MAG: 50S ribosomal protein L10 [Pseudanabaenaceae cyanobacterium SKYGB_i_bin29]|nr:50S ribosomal protein L10 [Pseudanabaenaceae cyanobacterium SKYG29]MDW8422298.1 50S ribosomal protein L10 [Pseudanabaenaceae cyanobacterium SKYGB_i_bin29]
MSRSLESKIAYREDLEKELSQAQMVMVVDFTGLTVAEITALRRKLRPIGTSARVTKNTIMKKAIAEQAKWKPIESYLKGPSVCLFVRKDIGETLKAYQAFAKEVKKTELRGGVFDGRAFAPDQIKAVADLPPKEVLLAQILGLLNNVPSRLAGTVKEVPASVARSINEVPASLARAIKAMQEKQSAGQPG